MPSASPLSPPRHFYSLDALRGIAALAVVFWHWQHFYFEGGALPAGFDASGQPLYSVFSLLYQRGWIAVDLFFALSGFIFFWLYSGPVAKREVGAWRFFALRFSRLYPLHLTMLLVVLALQWGYKAHHGLFFVYQENNAYHFGLHLFLASRWGFERDHSFNGPVWSVSVEALLYVAFFVLCRCVRVRWPHMLGAALLGLVVIYTQSMPIGRGLFAFFLGGLAYSAYAHALAAGRLRSMALWSSGAAILAWLGTLAWFYFAPAPVVAALGVDWARNYGAGLLFPLTILALASVETMRGHFGKRLSWLGDISYAAYMIHFSLELLAAWAVSALHLPRAVFNSPAMLVAFFAVLIAASLASPRWLERPAQRALRYLLLKGERGNARGPLKRAREDQPTAQCLYTSDR